MICGGTLKIACISVLALGMAVAPSVAAANPKPPAAADFSQPLAGKVKRVHGAAAADHHDHEAKVRFRTAPIAAPRRFDLVGVARTRADLEFRTRRNGKHWSEWVEVPDGSPVWAGGADWVQVRSRGGRIGKRLHYVNVRAGSGATASVSSKRKRKRRSKAGSLGYVPRSAWGANRRNEKGGCRPRVKPSYGTVKLTAIHHTVSTNTYSAATAPAVVLGICRYHRNANGWNDIGYNALVDRFGTLYEGRAGGINRAVIGAHAGGWNSRVTGVALIGNHVSAKPSAPAITKLVKYLAWKMATHGLTKAKGARKIRSDGGPLNRWRAGSRPRLNYVLTHRHLNETTCAGDGTEPLLKRTRKRIQVKLDKWAGNPPALAPTQGKPPPDPDPSDPTEPTDPTGGTGGGIGGPT